MSDTVSREAVVAAVKAIGGISLGETIDSAVAAIRALPSPAVNVLDLAHELECAFNDHYDGPGSQGYTFRKMAEKVIEMLDVPSAAEVVVAEGEFKRGKTNAHVASDYVDATFSGNATEVARAFATDGQRVKVILRAVGEKGEK